MLLLHLFDLSLMTRFQGLDFLIVLLSERLKPGSSRMIKHLHLLEDRDDIGEQPVLVLISSVSLAKVSRRGCQTDAVSLCLGERRYIPSELDGHYGAWLALYRTPLRQFVFLAVRNVGEKGFGGVER